MLKVNRLKSINIFHVNYATYESFDDPINSVLRAFFEMIFECHCFVIHSTVVELYQIQNIFESS